MIKSQENFNLPAQWPHSLVTTTVFTLLILTSMKEGYLKIAVLYLGSSDGFGKIYAHLAEMGNSYMRLHRKYMCLQEFFNR